jgi:rhodanese-related sulfurtransferase
MDYFKTPQDIKKRLDAKNPNDVLLDVRTPSEFGDGHIQGAINLNIGGLDAILKIQKLDKSKTYILYCRSGGRSKMASMIMAQSGFDIINCQFGFMHLEGSGVKISD